SEEFIKSSVENLVPIPSESEGIPDNMCDVPFHDNSPPSGVSKDQFEDFSYSNYDSTLYDDDSFSIDNIDLPPLLLTLSWRRLTPLIILYSNLKLSALIWKRLVMAVPLLKFKEDLFTYCIENGILQDSSEPSNDNTNVVNALHEPFVVNQDPGENSSQSSSKFNHHCCYECGAHYGYNCPPKVPVVPNLEPFNNQTVDELPQNLPSFDPTCYSEDGNSFTYDSTSNLVHDSPNTILEIELAFEDKHCQQEDILELFRRLHNVVQNIHEELAVYINTLNWDRSSVCYDDDDDEEENTIAITPEEPDNSLSMGDEHFNTVSATESDEFIKSSVENLVPILSESEGIPDNMCDVPFHDNSPPSGVSKDQFEDFSYSNYDSTLYDDDSFSIDNIEYVEASPPNSELVSLEVMEIFIPEVRGIDDDILLIIKDDILREKLLNFNLLIANIKALKDNPALSSNFMTKSSSTSLNSLLEETNTFDKSLLEFETFCFDLEEISNGSTTTRYDSSLYDSFIFDLLINPFPPADRSDFYEFTDELTHIISTPDYDRFCFKNEPNLGDFTMDVVEDIFLTREPIVHNALPTHPTLQLNLDFILSSESLFSYVLSYFFFHAGCISSEWNFHEINVHLKVLNESLIIPGNVKTHVKGFCPPVFISSASLGNHDRFTVCYDDDDDEDYAIAVTPSLSTEEPDNSLIMEDEHLDTIPTTGSDEFIKSSVEDLVSIPSESESILDNMCDVPFHDNSLPLNVSKDQFEDFSDSNDESTLIDDDSFSIDNIEYVEASPPASELVSLEVMEIVISEVGGINDDILLTIKDDILHEKLLNVNLLIANIEALKDNPTSSSDFMTKSSSTSLNYLLEETNNFDNSLHESKTFCFSLEEISSGSTTTRSNISFSDYEALYDNHVKEISSAADRSDFYHDEFADELAHIISPPEYDCFCFKNKPNSRDFTMDVVENIFPTREPRVHVHNALPTHPTLRLNLDFILSSESLFTYVIWIFLPFLSYSVAPEFLLSFGNEDTIFDPGISSYHISSFMLDVSHRSGTFIKFKVLNESPMEILFCTCSPIDQ
nr:hypothetical protein [Tanacetum cinerariifolium]